MVLTGLLLTPFTGGTSLGLATYGGWVAGAGSVTTVGGTLGEMYHEKPKGESLEEEMDKRTQKLCGKITKLQEKVQENLEDTFLDSILEKNKDKFTWKTVREGLEITYRGGTMVSAVCSAYGRSQFQKISTELLKQVLKESPQLAEGLLKDIALTGLRAPLTCPAVNFRTSVWLGKNIPWLGRVNLGTASTTLLGKWASVAGAGFSAAMLPVTAYSLFQDIQSLDKESQAVERLETIIKSVETQENTLVATVEGLRAVIDA